MAHHDHENEKTEQETDPFSLFLFGRRNPRRNQREITEEYEVENQEEYKVENQEREREDWPFGKKREHHIKESFFGPARNRQRENFSLFDIGNRRKQEKNTLMDLLENVDLMELMGHIDKLSSTASELKPYFKKIKPLFQQFLNKK